MLKLKVNCHGCDAPLAINGKIVRRWVLVNWWNGLAWVTRRWCIACSKEHAELMQRVSDQGGTIKYFDPSEEEL